jgi:hypothetical protein
MNDYIMWERRNQIGLALALGLPSIVAYGNIPIRPLVRFTGRPYVTPEEKARRRRRNEIAKLSRKRNRMAA